MKRFLLATVSMVALTSVARAADMPAAMPTKERMYSPVPAATWDGAYIGVQGGGVRRDTTNTYSAFDLTQAGSKTGSGGGALAGYNWQQGSFVYGLEGDWNWVSAKSSTLGLNLFSSYDVSWLATIRARAGLAFDSTLFYLTGGAAFGRVKDRVAFLGGDGITVQTSYTQDQTRAGWTVGAGVEHMFASNWAARAEFRFVDLGKTSADCVPGSLSCGTNSRADFNSTMMMGLVGLSYKFGGSRAADWSHAQAYAPPSNPVWTGAYLGIQGGVVHHDAFFDDSGDFITAGLFDEKKTGATVGGLLGYNWQQGSFVYGVEGDWNWIGGKTSRLTEFNSSENLSTSFDVNWLATLRGRAGLAFDATLVYVTGGAAFGHVRNSFEGLLTGTPVPSFSFTQNQTKVGWAAGVGVEHMLSQHWTARAEFRYVDLGTTAVACSSANDRSGCVSSGYRGDFSNTLKLGLVGLNYKF
jgi:outer membrane immunogenic protein